MFGDGGGGCGNGGGRGGGQGLGKRRRVQRAAAFVDSANPESVAAPTVLSASTGPSPAAVGYVARAVRAGQCTACGACEAACPQGAITVDGMVTVDESQCTACGECMDACAFDVLSLQPR